MKKKIISMVLLLAMCVSMLTACGEEEFTVTLPTAMEQSEIFVTPIEGISDDFIKGVDISSLLAEEASGVKYYSESGEEQDLLKTLAEAGITHVRVRVWNNPYDEDGNGYGGGNCDVNTAMEIGKRAAKYGLKLLVDFHYSDFWADPSKQMSPKAWESMLIHEKEEAIYEYTKESLNKIIEAGADVAMVQIGNEINSGMAGEKNTKNICKLLSSASKAVREVSQDIKIAVHYTNIEKVGDMEKKAQQLLDNGVDYDVFGVSYYAYWHGSFENLVDTLSGIKEKFGKETCILETSYMWTSEEGDGFSNNVSAEDALDAYPVSVQGQATLVRDVCAAAVEAGALGVFYWEPAWIPVGSSYDSNVSIWEEHGSGWASKYSVDYDPEDAGVYYGGCSWDNQAMFDHSGHPLASLNVWKYLKYGSEAETVEVLSVINPSIEVECRTELNMPETVTAVYNDPTCTDPLAVTWSESQVAAIDLTVPAKYVIDGMTSDGHVVTCNVKVYNENLLSNGSFEEDDEGSIWKVTYLSNEGITDYQNKVADAITGNYALHWYDTANIEFQVEQTITVQPGKYTATTYIQGGDMGDNAQIVFYVIVGDTKIESNPITLEGWIVWQNPYIRDIEVTEETEVTVGMYVKGASAGWGTMDDFEFYSQE